MIKLLHAADLHLDSPFSGLSPEQAAARRKEQRELPAKLAELCRVHGCDALLLAGDVFDGESVAPETVEALLAAFAACPCPVFLAPGNHDPLSAASPYRTERWPVNVHIFASRAISPVELPEQHCRVFGAGFESAYESGLLGGFSAPQDGWVNVMVLHGDALNPNSPYNAVTKEQIAASGLRYLALGHIHQASGLLRAGHTAYAWPGCAMGRGFDELGAKGAYLGTLDENGCKLEFLPLCKRKYEILRVAAGSDALAAVEAALPEQTQDDIYRVILTGEAEPVDVRALYEALKGRFFGLTLRDETTPRRDLWAGCEDDTLRGLFLRALKKKFDASTSEDERQTIALAARYGTYALEERTVEP